VYFLKSRNEETKKEYYAMHTGFNQTSDNKNTVKYDSIVIVFRGRRGHIAADKVG
jgi:hypothetical protein